MNNQCDECNAQLVSAIYKSDQTKFKDGVDEKSGCVFCSEYFMPLVEKHRAVASRPIGAGGRGGSGASRGGRGGAAGQVTQNGRGGAASGRGAGRGGRGGPPMDKMAQLASYFV